MEMKRVAIAAPVEQSRAVLAEVAGTGLVEIEFPVDRAEDRDELDEAVDAAVVSGPIAGWVGWLPGRDVATLAATLAPLGASVVSLARPRGIDPPTLLAGTGRAGISRSLVETYGTVPYADVDPSRLAGVAYVVMFGMMFGDLGHGAVLLVAGLLLRAGKIPPLVKYQKAWSFVVGGGLVSMLFGALYGEAFGPTGLVPVLWLAPLDNPIPLMLTALVFGAVLLAGAYVIGTINRFREGGWGYALYAGSGLAGSLLFVAVGLLAWGVIGTLGPVIAIATVLAVSALVLLFIGFFVEAGRGATGAMQAVIEVVDSVIRLGSNLVSFARLAAFGLTHAALLTVVWSGTTALWAPDWRAAAAILVFLVGNVLTFGLEALVAGIQALRLEYYELFSRIFQSEGRPFRPWSLKPAADPHPVSSSERHPA
jgi:V/A-type H+-transporting ATPase subunit I